MADTSGLGSLYNIDPDAAPGQPGSLEYAQLMRRALASELAKERPYPKNLGEGLTAVGEALGQQRQLDQLRSQLQKQAVYENNRVRGGGDTSSSYPYGGNTAAPVAPPVPPRTAAVAPPAPPVPPAPPTPPAPSVPTAPVSGLPTASFSGTPTVASGLYAGPNMFGTAVNSYNNPLPGESAPGRDKLAMMLAARQGGNVLPPGTVPSEAAGTFNPAVTSSPYDTPLVWTDPNDTGPFGSSDAAATDAASSIPTTIGTDGTDGDDGGDDTVGAGERPVETAPAPRRLTPMFGGGTATNPPIVVPDISKAPPAPVTATRSLPSQEPIAELQDPGAPPPEPGPVPISDKQAYWLRLAQDPTVSPETQKAAMKQFEIQEGFRKTVQDYQHSLWEKQFTNWQALKKEFDNKLDQQTKRQAIEAQRGVMEGQTLENILKGNQVGQIPIANEKALADLQAAKVMAIGDKRYLFNPKDSSYTDITPDVKPEDIKLNETQARTLKALERAKLAGDQFNNSTASSGYSGYFSSLGSKLPLGLGNLAQTDAYRQSRAAALTWATSVLRDESGASIRPDEARDKLDLYFPVPGDDAKTIHEKAIRRANEEQSLIDSLGAAKPLADKYMLGRSIPDGTVQKNPTTGEVRVRQGGAWVMVPANGGTTLTVPVPMR